jgi:pimeloyl-ACP methyl ester carboxylesterase
LVAGGFLTHTLLYIVQARFPGATAMHWQECGTSGLVLFALTARCGVPSRRSGARAGWWWSSGIARSWRARLHATRFPSRPRSGRLRDRRALIFWGLRAPGFPRVDLARFEKAFPDHKTIELADADHFFFEDEAARMIPEIRSFAARRPR